MNAMQAEFSKRREVVAEEVASKARETEEEAAKSAATRKKLLQEMQEQGPSRLAENREGFQGAITW